MILLSLKTRYKIPREIIELRAYLKEVKAVNLKTSRLGLSIYK
jgi:hypothetical protein